MDLDRNDEEWLEVSFYDKEIASDFKEFQVTFPSSSGEEIQLPSGNLGSRHEVLPFGGVHHFIGGGSAFHDRVLVWRVVFDCLEMIDVGLQRAVRNGAARFRFPSTLLSRLTIFEDEDGVIVLVATAARSVHRLFLPFPGGVKMEGNPPQTRKRMKAVDSRSKSLGTMWIGDEKAQSELSEKRCSVFENFSILDVLSAQNSAFDICSSQGAGRTTCFCAVDVRTGFVGFVSGSIVKIVFPEDKFGDAHPEVTEFCASSALKRLWSSISIPLMSSGSPVAVCDIVSLPGSNMLCSLGEDKRLRLWQTLGGDSKGCFHVVDLDTASAGGWDPTASTAGNGTIRATRRRSDWLVAVVLPTTPVIIQMYSVESLKGVFSVNFLFAARSLVPRKHQLVDLIIAEQRCWIATALGEKCVVQSFVVKRNREEFEDDRSYVTVSLSLLRRAAIDGGVRAGALSRMDDPDKVYSWLLAQHSPLGLTQEGGNLWLVRHGVLSLFVPARQEPVGDELQECITAGRCVFESLSADDVYQCDDTLRRSGTLMAFEVDTELRKDCYSVSHKIPGRRILSAMGDFVSTGDGSPVGDEWSSMGLLLAGRYVVEALRQKYERLRNLCLCCASGGSHKGLLGQMCGLLRPVSLALWLLSSCVSVPLQNSHCVSLSSHSLFTPLVVVGSPISAVLGSALRIGSAMSVSAESVSTVGNFLLSELLAKDWELRCAVGLLISGQIVLLETFLELVGRFDARSSFKYIQGEVFLALGSLDRAVDLFLMSAEEVAQSGLVSVPKENPEHASAYFLLSLAQRFDGQNCASGVLSLCYRALEILAPITPHAPGLEISRPLQDERKNELVSVLLALAFRHCVGLGRVDEAYTMVLSFPGCARQRDCLRYLVKWLVEDRRVDLLCRLPLGPFSEDVECVLLSEARVSAVSKLSELFGAVSLDRTRSKEPISVYEMLFSWHMKRGMCTKAAEVMLEYADRLETEERSGQNATVVRDLLQKHDFALLLSVNALLLANEKYAWFLPSVERDDEEAAVEGREFIQPMIATAADIRKRRLLVSARLKLLLCGGDDVVHVRNPEDVSQLLLLRGLYDDAVSLCKMFDLDLRPVFTALSGHCTDHGFEEPVDSMLQSFLKKFDGPKTNFEYHKAVAEVLLENGVRLPEWLRKSYGSRHPGAFRRLLLSVRE